MVREMIRVTKPGGTVAAYVWDYAGGMEMLRCFWDAAVAVNPQDTQLDQAERFPLCQPTPLTRLWQDLGLKAVTVRAITIPTVFHDFDDYWTPFLGKQGAAPTYLAAVDTETRSVVLDVLDQLRQDGITVLLATHELDHMAIDPNDIVHLADGRVVTECE